MQPYLITHTRAFYLCGFIAKHYRGHDDADGCKNSTALAGAALLLRASNCLPLTTLIGAVRLPHHRRQLWTV